MHTHTQSTVVCPLGDMQCVEAGACRPATQTHSFTSLHCTSFTDSLPYYHISTSPAHLASRSASQTPYTPYIGQQLNQPHTHKRQENPPTTPHTHSTLDVLQALDLCAGVCRVEPEVPDDQGAHRHDDEGPQQLPDHCLVRKLEGRQRIQNLRDQTQHTHRHEHTNATDRETQDSHTHTHSHTLVSIADGVCICLLPTTPPRPNPLGWMDGWTWNE